MPLFEISIAKGRTKEELRNLISEVHRAAEATVRATPENTTVIIREVEPSLWSKGDQTISERRTSQSKE